MYFSRPKIAPLNLDLTGLTPDGSHSFIGKTSDGRAIEIKYRSSWIQVWIAADKTGKPNYSAPNLAASIGPPHHGFILPEQVCDLLGLTLEGQKPVLKQEQLDKLNEYEPVLDWTGATTYWESWHYLHEADLHSLIKDIMRIHSDSHLFRMEYKDQKRQYRRVSQSLDTDKNLVIGVSPKCNSLKSYILEKLKWLPLASRDTPLNRFETLFNHTIHISCLDPWHKKQSEMYGRDALNQFYEADKFNLDYETPYPMLFCVRTHYKTEAPEGIQFMQTLHNILQQHFFSEPNLLTFKLDKH